MNKLFTFLSVMAIAAMTLVSASAGAETREVSWVCPEGVQVQRYRCTPGEWFYATLRCANGQSMPYAHQCTPESEPEYVPVETRLFLVLDVGLSAGAIGFGGHTTGIGLLHLGLELRPRQDVGFLAEGRLGISGEFQQEQTRKFSSYFGGAAYFTWRPADFVRLAFGLSGFTARASTWKNVLSGVAGSMRLDFTVGGEWRLGLVGDIGSGWSPCSQKVYWMGLFGVSYGAPVINLEDK